VAPMSSRGTEGSNPFLPAERPRLSTRISLPRSRSRAFRANVRVMPGDRAGRDAYGRATWRHWRLMSWPGQIFSTAGPVVDRS
jgi:hypothetical protein